MSIEDVGVVDFYERNAATWAEARSLETTFYEKGWFDRFCGLIPEGGSVLDCGCGSGEPIARYLSERGYAVTGIDASPAMVEMFRTRLPRQRAFVTDMRALSRNELFDGILAWDSFFHLDHDDQRRMFPIFRAHAASGAALMFTAGPSHGEVVGRLFGEALYHASLDAVEYHELLEAQGFAVVATVAEDKTCGGRTVWLAQLRSADCGS